MNLMVMMMITTMFIGVNQTLPKTSDIKMVDYWLVFNLLIPFVEVLMQVYRETLEWTEIEENETLLPQSNNIVEPILFPVTNETLEVTKCESLVGEENYNRLAPVKERRAMTDREKFRCSQILVKTVFPVIVLLFMSIYWIIGLCLYYNPNI